MNTTGSIGAGKKSSGAVDALEIVVAIQTVLNLAERNAVSSHLNIASYANKALVITGAVGTVGSGAKTCSPIKEHLRGAHTGAVQNERIWACATSDRIVDI